MDLDFTFRLRIIILFNPNLITDSINIQYHIGLNDCDAKHFPKVVHFYAFNPKIHIVLISIEKDSKTN